MSMLTGWVEPPAAPGTASLGAGTQSEREDAAAAATEATLPAEDAAPLHLAALGLSAKELHTLGAILHVIKARTEAAWEFGDLDQADVVIAPLALARDPDRGAPLRGRTVIPLVGEDGPLPREDDLILTTPIRVMAVLDALNLASRRHRHGSPAPPSAAKSGDAAVSSESCLATVLLPSLARTREDHALRIRILSAGAIYVWPAERLFHVDFPLSLLPRIVMERRFVMTTAPAQAPELMTLRDQAIPLAPLLWSIGTAPTRCETQPEAAAYRLLRWPEFDRLPHEMGHLRLCGVMAGASWTLDALQAQSGLPHAFVARFLRACLACGYAGAEAQGTAPPATAPPRRAPSAPGGAGLLERLWRRLGFGAA